MAIQIPGRLSVKAEFEIDEREFKRTLRLFGPKANKVATQAISAALNKTVRKARTDIVREVSDESGVQQKLIRRRIRIRLASPSNTWARLWLGVRGISVRAAGGKQNKHGVKAGGHFVPGGFFATMPGGGRTVFKRKGRARLPIKKQTIPLLPGATSIVQRVQRDVMRSKYPAFLKHEFEFRIKKLMRPR